MVARFDGRNPRAERFLTGQSSQLVREIVEDQRDAIRRVLTAGMEAGQNPQAVALDIVGRVNRATGRREGGMIGLHSQQIEWAEAAHAQLRSGDPAQLRAYLERRARNKRFDWLVMRAANDGKPVSAADARRIIGKYRDNLLRLRGETIARTEMLRSLHEAQDEGLRQLIDAGKLDADQVTRVWDATGDGRVRDTHRAMDEQKTGLNGVFTSPTGAVLRYPGDQSAPAAETINCRCAVRIEIDYFKGLT